MNINDTLPIEIISMILDYTYRCVNRSVCKSWNMAAHNTGLNICEDAVRYSWMNVLEWIDETELLLCSSAFIIACRNENVEVFNWITAHDWPFNGESHDDAIIIEHIPALEFIRSREQRVDECSCNFAAYHGKLNSLKWLISNGYPITDYTTLNAAKKDHIHILRWFVENNYALHSDICSFAAESGNLDMLKWLYQLGYKLVEPTPAHAAKSGHIETLKWCRENMSFWNNTWVYAWAGMKGRVEVLKWLLDNDCPWDSVAIGEARKYNRQNVLAWAQENRLT